MAKYAIEANDFMFDKRDHSFALYFGGRAYGFQRELRNSAGVIASEARLRHEIEMTKDQAEQLLQAGYGVSLVGAPSEKKADKKAKE